MKNNTISLLDISKNYIYLIGLIFILGSCIKSNDTSYLESRTKDLQEAGLSIITKKSFQTFTSASSDVHTMEITNYKYACANNTPRLVAEWTKNVDTKTNSESTKSVYYHSTNECFTVSDEFGNPIFNIHFSNDENTFTYHDGIDFFAVMNTEGQVTCLYNQDFRKDLIWSDHNIVKINYYIRNTAGAHSWPGAKLFPRDLVTEMKINHNVGKQNALRTRWRMIATETMDYDTELLDPEQTKIVHDGIFFTADLLPINLNLCIVQKRFNLMEDRDQNPIILSYTTVLESKDHLPIRLQTKQSGREYDPFSGKVDEFIHTETNTYAYASPCKVSRTTMESR